MEIDSLIPALPALGLTALGIGAAAMWFFAGGDAAPAAAATEVDAKARKAAKTGTKRGGGAKKAPTPAAAAAEAPAASKKKKKKKVDAAPAGEQSKAAKKNAKKKAKKKAAAAAAVSGTISDVEVRKICGAARERKRSDVKKGIYHTVGAVTAFPLAVWGIAEAASTCCSRTRAASNFNCSSPLQSTAKLLCMRYGMKIKYYVVQLNLYLLHLNNTGSSTHTHTRARAPDMQDIAPTKAPVQRLPEEELDGWEVIPDKAKKKKKPK